MNDRLLITLIQNVLRSTVRICYTLVTVNFTMNAQREWEKLLYTENIITGI